MNSLRKLHKLFKYEDLSPNQDQSYMLRWTLFSGFGRKVYLHKILATDWAREPHDHPKDFVSIGLSGRYVEEVYEVVDDYSTDDFSMYIPQRLTLKDMIPFKAPWIRRFPAEHIHRLAVRPGEHCWTICITSPHQRAWGFWSADGTWTEYKRFMRNRFPEGWS